MNRLDDELRKAMRTKAEEWNLPEKGRGELMQKIAHLKAGSKRRGGRAAVLVLAAVLIVPSAAYAGYSYLADELYGSRDTLLAIGGTSADYERLESKLRAAQAHFSEDEFNTLMQLLKSMAGFALKHAGEHGRLDLERLSPADRQTYEAMASQAEPYMARLHEAQEESGRAAQDRYWKQKLREAEELFTPEAYAAFEVLFKRMQHYESMVVDKHGSAHMERLTVEERQDFDQLYKDIYPYFKQLGIDAAVPKE